ncbi:MAG TPA: hypothetical protein VG820_03235 [Fimbriimonadaceae bacterium]|nr:hypothetical protein [Fimbriimonadaceae bacterium]
MGTLASCAVFLAALCAAPQESGLQWAGRTYSLGPARMIAAPVEDAVWAPDGADIAYVSHTDSGARVGIFDLKRDKGGVVANLGPNEKLEQTIWLNAGHKLLLVIRQPVEGREKPTDLLTVKVADAIALSSDNLWAKEFPADENATLEINPSPSLCHALVTVRAQSSQTYLVMTESAKSLVISSDIAEAVKEGHQMEGWSIYGTAMFGNATQTSANAERQEIYRIEYALFRAEEASAGRQRSVLPDDYALEVVPANGVLRQVRFPGYFQPIPSNSEWLQPYFQQSTLTLGQSSAGIRSLWLVLQKEVKAPTQGILVSAQADGGWMSPSGKDVAFTSHHALFVRPIEAKR